MSATRLDKLLANLGYGSRKEIGLLVRAKRITLRGEVLRDHDAAITSADASALRIDGEPIDPPSPLTVMLNKPEGYICSHDEKGKLVYDLLPERWKLRKPALS